MLTGTGPARGVRTWVDALTFEPVGSIFSRNGALVARVGYWARLSRPRRCRLSPAAIVGLLVRKRTRHVAFVRTTDAR